MFAISVRALVTFLSPCATVTSQPSFEKIVATTPREEDINNEMLIQKIEMRPVLYNKSLKEYSDTKGMCKGI